MASVSRFRPTPGTLYVAHNPQHDFFKIGSTETALQWRNNELERFLGAKIIFTIDVDNRGMLEYELHDRLTPYRVRVRPRLVPGRKPQKISRECYRTTLETITGLIPQILRERRIEPVTVPLPPVTNSVTIPPMPPPRTQNPSAGALRARRHRDRVRNGPKKAAPMSDSNADRNAIDSNAVTDDSNAIPAEPAPNVDVWITLPPPVLEALYIHGWLSPDTTPSQAVARLLAYALRNGLRAPPVTNPPVTNLPPAAQPKAPPRRQPQPPALLTPDEERAARTMQRLAAIQDDTVGADEEDWSQNQPPELTTRSRT